MQLLEQHQRLPPPKQFEAALRVPHALDAAHYLHDGVEAPHQNISDHRSARDHRRVHQMSSTAADHGAVAG